MTKKQPGRKRKRKRKFKKNLRAIQLNAEKYVRENLPWLTEPKSEETPQKRIYRAEALFISR